MYSYHESSYQRPCTKLEEVAKGHLEIRPSIPFLLDISYNDLDNDKSKFIKFLCRYTPGIVDYKKIKYQAHVKIFDHGSPEIVLLWYNKRQ